MSSTNSSLRPAWRNQSGGKGFQPPPSVNADRARSTSIGSEGSEKSQGRIYNKFSALDDEDDFEVVGGSSPPTKSRLEGLRQGLATRSSSQGSKAASSGRSLADLAAKVPEKQSSAAKFKEENVIKFTRERLLSMRPQPKEERPAALDHLEGTVVLAEQPQDPVCFDDFDADAIWATVPARRSSSAKLTRESSQGESSDPRRSSMRTSGSAGRWQRGVALPPPSANPSTSRGSKDVITDNPEDLWDDPVTSGAAADFSAFGDLGDEDGGGGVGDAFDFEKMAEQSRLLEDELHPGNEAGKSNGLAPGAPRPLSVMGTTIQSGSGDDVNVFEDFDDPAAEPTAPATETSTTVDAKDKETAAVKGATEDPSASSRLMAMIGVNPNNENTGLSLAALVGAPATSDAAPSADAPAPAPGPSSNLSGWGSSTEGEKGAVPLNPWGGSSLLGGPVVPTPRVPAQQQQQQDPSMQARLEMEQKAREQLRRQQELEARKRAEQQQQKQQGSQQQPGVQSQVELVLMERVSTILENSWGRSDLSSILSTLHAEDSRVIPLLSSVDALRALLMRSSNRVQLQHDPAFGSEMAVLVLTNSQWQQQQAARAREEEMRRRMQQQQEEQLKQAQRQRADSSASSRKALRPDAPWFYSDPQGNIQGPFRPDEMRQWLVAGYFNGELPVCQDPNGPFLALSSIFTDLNAAFVFNGEPATQPGPSQADARRAEEDAQRRIAAERELEARRAQEAAEKERQRQMAQEQEAERQRRAAAEEEERRAQAERKAQEAQAAASNGANESSAQLKMMLGLSNMGGNNKASGATVPGAPTPTPTPVARRKVADPKKEPNKKSSAGPTAAPESQPPKPAPPAASPWGSASQPSRKKSMSEIQQEEARAAAIVAMQRESSRSSSSGWANVAASKGGTSGWTGGAARVAPAAVLTRPQAPQAAATSRPRGTRKNVVDVTAANMQSAAQQPQGKGSSAEDFGAKMSPALEKWCKEQMMKLNGTDDLTLVSFCMTLNDPNEIRQYLTAYLGSSPNVNNFATEFINRKLGVKPAKEEWETTTTSKKKGKKKGGK